MSIAHSLLSNFDLPEHMRNVEFLTYVAHPFSHAMDYGNQISTTNNEIIQLQLDYRCPLIKHNKYLNKFMLTK
jgi:hypothetical protein